MIFPPYLHPGDRIRIVAPAGKVVKEKVMPGIELLQEAGYEVLIGNHVFDKHFQFAGADYQRLADFQEALNDPAARVIVCARGGYGAVHLVDKLDFSPLLAQPKWIAGFSDITLIHVLLNKLQIASVHGAMPAFYTDNKKPTKSFYSLLDALAHGRSQIEMDPCDFNRPGKCEGELVGGNLSLIYSLQGTPWQLDTKGKILFLEDVSEYLYHLDRMMHNLRLSGALNNLAGLVLGGFTDMKDNESPFGKSTYEIIYDAVKDYHFPVCFDFPGGHIPKNLSLIMGARYSLETGSQCILKRIDHESGL